MTIPASCTQVGDDAFLGCDALYAVTIEDDSTAFGKRSLGYLYDNRYMVKPGFVIDADTGTGVQYALDNGILRKSGLICGDVNADSSLTVLDAVMLQKWLLGAGRLTNPAAGDLCEDGTINSFDLAAMKRRLLHRAAFLFSSKIFLKKRFTNSFRVSLLVGGIRFFAAYLSLRMTVEFCGWRS